MNKSSFQAKFCPGKEQKRVDVKSTLRAPFMKRPNICQYTIHKHGKHGINQPSGIFSQKRQFYYGYDQECRFEGLGASLVSIQALYVKPISDIMVSYIVNKDTATQISSNVLLQKRVANRNLVSIYWPILRKIMLNNFIETKL